MIYKNYFLNKYRKYKIKNNKFISLILIIIFIINKFICYILIVLINKKNKINQPQNNKKILFIEPIHQGFGDLLFQSPLFKSWSKKGYVIDILLSKKEHGDIIKNNPHINKIFTWNIIYLFIIFFTKYKNIFCLCRNSIKENILLIIKISSDKIIPDLDLELWKKSFSNNSNTIAWQIIINTINPHLYSRGIPKIFFSENEKKYISKNKKSQIVIVAGTKNKFKQIPIFTNFLSQIPNYLLDKIILIGKEKNKIIPRLSIKNLINKLTYRETILEIARSNLVIGPEGSLIHISSVIGKKTIIWDPENKFIKNAHPLLLNKNNQIFIQKQKELENIINYMNLFSEKN